MLVTRVSCREAGFRLSQGNGHLTARPCCTEGQSRDCAAIIKRSGLLPENNKAPSRSVTDEKTAHLSHKTLPNGTFVTDLMPHPLRAGM